MTHYLKIKPSYFESISSGQKTFEFRKNDRDYHIGDELILAEYDTLFTGRKVAARISYILNADDICQAAAGYVILGITIHDISEFQVIVDYARNADFDNSICWEQLRALWTTYCIHNKYECDTSAYDSKLIEIWSCMNMNESEFSRFDTYMCEHLV